MISGSSAKMISILSTLRSRWDPSNTKEPSCPKLHHVKSNRHAKEKKNFDIEEIGEIGLKVLFRIEDSANLREQVLNGRKRTQIEKRHQKKASLNSPKEQRENFKKMSSARAEGRSNNFWIPFSRLKTSIKSILSIILLLLKTTTKTFP
jgi:hypothetical protein